MFERGGVLRQVRGKSERCLVLGAAVLDGMRVRGLKAILAHEYGHFHNEDTAGGGFALAVARGSRRTHDRGDARSPGPTRHSRTGPDRIDSGAPVMAVVFHR